MNLHFERTGTILISKITFLMCPVSQNVCSDKLFHSKHIVLGWARTGRSIRPLIDIVKEGAEELRCNRRLYVSDTFSYLSKFAKPQLLLLRRSQVDDVITCNNDILYCPHFSWLSINSVAVEVKWALHMFWLIIIWYKHSWDCV